MVPFVSPPAPPALGLGSREAHRVAASVSRLVQPALFDFARSVERWLEQEASPPLPPPPTSPLLREREPSPPPPPAPISPEPSPPPPPHPKAQPPSPPSYPLPMPKVPEPSPPPPPSPLPPEPHPPPTAPMHAWLPSDSPQPVSSNGNPPSTLGEVLHHEHSPHAKPPIAAQQANAPHHSTVPCGLTGCTSTGRGSGALAARTRGPGFASHSALASLPTAHSHDDSGTHTPEDRAGLEPHQHPRTTSLGGMLFLALVVLVSCVVFRPRSIDIMCMRLVRAVLLVVRPQRAHEYSSRNLSSFEIRTARRGGEFQRLGTYEL